MTRRGLILALVALGVAGLAASLIFGTSDKGLLGRAGIKAR